MIDPTWPLIINHDDIDHDVENQGDDRSIGIIDVIDHDDVFQILEV